MDALQLSEDEEENESVGSEVSQKLMVEESFFKTTTVEEFNAEMTHTKSQIEEAIQKELNEALDGGFEDISVNKDQSILCKVRQRWGSDMRLGK